MSKLSASPAVTQTLLVQWKSPSALLSLGAAPTCAVGSVRSDPQLFGHAAVGGNPGLAPGVTGVKPRCVGESGNG